ncbi:MAG: hypothetical protein ACKOW8_08765, partial [Flavobacteriales bacterium]
MKLPVQRTSIIVVILSLSSSMMYGQALTPGLEGILLEKFYEVNEKDRSVQHLSGVIDEGAVTWRIFLDLEPGYRFQAAYGTTEHPLEFKSTALIYNHNGYGNYCP